MEKGKSTSVSKSGKMAAAQRPGSTQSISSSIPPDQRQHMIEEAAYYRAERRGFHGGDPLQDWLEAEAEIERMMSGKRH
jgi:hypothetical protein